MSIRSDHKALIFVGAIAVLGAGVRVVRAATSSDVKGGQPALEHQMQAADSAATAGRRRQGVHVPRDSAKRRRGGITRAARGDSTSVGPPSANRRGYVNGRLDLDVATAAQIDSLPGVSTLMAKRIAADRMQHGPFLNLQRLRRVSGAGPAFLRRIDSLVTFSGVVPVSNPNDSLIVRRSRK